MDFGTILHKASKNDSQKKEVRYYSTKFEPPKKEQREKKTLSANIQKFLARKEAEEKQKVNGERQIRDQLLELRSKDKKATRRVNVMLKRTKSANQSVLDDAIDVNNTAVTLAGPSQPDEDDYGYVSQSAADYYNKMMDKYSKMPDEPKFKLEKKKVSTNLTSTMDRVKAALEREKEEALLPHKRKRKPKETSDVNDVPEEEEPKEKKKDKPKPRPNMPPPMNFSDLLKMAEKKQFEPIMIEVKEKEEEKLLTKKQRREADQQREYFQQKEARKANANKPASQNPVTTVPKFNNPATLSKTNSEVNKKAPKLSSIDHGPGPSKFAGQATVSQLNKKTDRPNIPNKTSTESNRPQNQSPNNQKRVSENNQNCQPQRNLGHSTLTKGEASRNSKPLQQNIIKSRDAPPPDRIPSQSKSGSRPMSSNSKAVPSRSDYRPKESPRKEVRPKEFPPRDMKPKYTTSKDGKSKIFPPNDVQGKPVRSNANPRRIYDDEDEDEYDSEMDDFIDDGDEEDVSRHIKEIFGYDKRKYSRVDDDCADMESSFAQQMREEVISTKIAIKEDLEEMKLEEELKKRKAIMKKRK